MDKLLDLPYKADLHLHSRFSEGTSASLTWDNIVVEAKKKGINVLGTGDALHKEWLNEVLDQCQVFHDCLRCWDIYVFPSAEVCCVWDKNQVHILLVFAHLHDVFILYRDIKKLGNFSSGRPKIAISPQELKSAVKELKHSTLFVLAHALTPWFGFLGWGNSLTPEHAAELAPDAIETGLSATPSMYKVLGEIKDIPLVSFSDAHSVPKLGREFTMYATPSVIEETVFNQTFVPLDMVPQLGKYFGDGHRKCGYAGEGRCHCGRTVTRGTLSRVEFFLGRKLTQEEIWGNDLVYVPQEDTEEGIRLARLIAQGQLRVIPGFDGKFGKILDETESAESTELNGSTTDEKASNDTESAGSKTEVETEAEIKPPKKHKKTSSLPLQPFLFSSLQ